MITKLFLNDRFILAVILLNCIILFLEELGVMHPAIVATDLVCLVLFAIEMVVKHSVLGAKGYWQNGIEKKLEAMEKK